MADETIDTLGLVIKPSWSADSAFWAAEFARRGLPATTGNGVFVAGLSEAHVDGLLENDIIVRVGSRQVSKAETWGEALATLQVSTEAKFVVKRVVDEEWKLVTVAVKPIDPRAVRATTAKTTEEGSVGPGLTSQPNLFEWASAKKGWAGKQHFNNQFVVPVPRRVSGEATISFRLSAAGPPDTSGTVSLVSPEGKRSQIATWSPSDRLPTSSGDKAVVSDPSDKVSGKLLSASLGQTTLMPGDYTIDFQYQNGASAAIIHLVEVSVTGHRDATLAATARKNPVNAMSGGDGEKASQRIGGGGKGTAPEEQLDQPGNEGDIRLGNGEKQKADSVRQPIPAQVAERGAQDFRQLIVSAGYTESAPSSWITTVPFVQYGSSENAKKALHGDQFDRLDAKKVAEAHRAQLRQKRLFLDGLHFRVANRDDVETKGLVVVVPLPMRVRGNRPFFEDPKSFSGALSMMHPSEVNMQDLWFLTKDKTLRKCNAAEAAVVKQNNGVLYYGEQRSTSLILILRSDLDVLKHIARNANDYSVGIEFTDLNWGSPLAWGCFRQDAVEEADWDCQKLWIDSLLNGEDPQPVYFVTAIVDNNADQIPEIAQASLASLWVTDKQGRIIGAYGIAK